MSADGRGGIERLLLLVTLALTRSPNSLTPCPSSSSMSPVERRFIELARRGVLELRPKPRPTPTRVLVEFDFNKPLPPLWLELSDPGVVGVEHGWRIPCGYVPATRGLRGVKIGVDCIGAYVDLRSAPPRLRLRELAVRCRLCEPAGESSPRSSVKHKVT